MDLSSLELLLEITESLSVIAASVAGLVFGIPLLRRKATEQYIGKRVDILFEANSELRKRCIELLDTYPIKGRSNRLEKDDVIKAVSDFDELFFLSANANHDACRYVNLVRSALHKFENRIGESIPADGDNDYCKEDFWRFLHNHIEMVLSYASSVGDLPKMSVKSEKQLNKRIDPFVKGNRRNVISDVKGSIKYYKADALLVEYYSVCMAYPKESALLRECCYSSAPDPGPIARLLYNQKIYFPLLLDVGQFFTFERLELNLVGFHRSHSYRIGSGIDEYFIELQYSNVSQIGFVEADVPVRENFLELKDSYIKGVSFSDSDIIDFRRVGETVFVKIPLASARRLFSKNKLRLAWKMKSETH